MFAGDMEEGGLCGGPGQEEEDVRIGQPHTTTTNNNNIIHHQQYHQGSACRG